MSTFACPLVKVQIETHPNADAIEIAKVGDYQTIVKKGQFKTGDLAVYIPEGALLPTEVLQHLGFWKDGRGTLTGPLKNRVKAIKLRGVLSEGVLLPIIGKPEWSKEGEDFSQIFGITKYEPPVPSSMRGAVKPYHDLAFKFEVENYKKYPDVFKEDEPVIITEKLHGTFAFFGLSLEESNNDDDMFYGQFIVGSKGLGGQGLFFKNTVDNVYTRVLPTLTTPLFDIAEPFLVMEPRMVFIVGEVLGVQAAFNYGKEQFRAFGAGIVTKKGEKQFFRFDKVKEILEPHGILTVPELYRGPLKKEMLPKLSNGKETVTGNQEHIREGVVIYPMDEGRDELIGRRILKYVGEQYLLGTTGEEFN